MIEFRHPTPPRSTRTDEQRAQSTSHHHQKLPNGARPRGCLPSILQPPPSCPRRPIPPRTPTSGVSTGAATMPKRSTATSSTPFGSDAPTAAAMPANTSTSLATRSWSTASRSTATSDTAPDSPPNPLERKTQDPTGFSAVNSPEIAREAPERVHPRSSRCAGETSGATRTNLSPKTGKPNRCTVAVWRRGYLTPTSQTTAPPSGL